MPSIITKHLAMDAILLAQQIAPSILGQEGACWGPRWAEIVIYIPGSDEPITGIIGEETDWDYENWGEKLDFGQIAHAKARLARRTGMSTARVVATHQDLLQEGDYIYTGGVAENPHSLAVGCSGACEATDECLAWIIFNLIMMRVGLLIRAAKKDDSGRIHSSV